MALIPEKMQVLHTQIFSVRRLLGIKRFVFFTYKKIVADTSDVSHVEGILINIDTTFSLEKICSL